MTWCPINRNAVYARYSENDWSNSNKAHYMLSDRERAQANTLRADAWRAVKVMTSLTTSHY